MAKNALALVDGSAELLKQLATEICEAQRDIETSAFEALQSAIRLGAAAMRAKDMLPRGEFLPWIDKNCKVSQPWVAQCMNAARVEALLHDRPQSEQKRLRASAGSIESFAKLYLPLKSGDADPLNPTTKPATRKPRKVGTTTTTLDNTTSDADVIDMPATREANVRDDLKAQREELDERERLLAVREADVLTREQRCEAWEQELREHEERLEKARQGLAIEVAAGMADETDAQELQEQGHEAIDAAVGGHDVQPEPELASLSIKARKVRKSRKAATPDWAQTSPQQ